MIKLSNRIITTQRTPIFFGNDVLPALDKIVASIRPGGIFILADLNTRKHCLPLLLERSKSVANAAIIEIDGGEADKSIENAGKIWQILMASGADRKSLLVNLGGGVVTDLGGFVAAGFQRGIKYINVPTSLMGQADAAIGGKTAVNLGHVKNQVGFFYPPEGVFIVPEFLKTLPEAQLRSGFAEIIKSVLIGNAALWRRVHKTPVNGWMNLPAEGVLWQDMILAAATYKNKVVAKDFREKKLRKVLNFGHTLGHAFESLGMQSDGEPLLHGEAVAAGIICAVYLSHVSTGLSTAEMHAVTDYIREGYRQVPFQQESGSLMLDIARHDKKNHDGSIRFTLLSKVGVPQVNTVCGDDQVLAALAYYGSSYK
ncbi:MAG: 3-dehydroquinate synthase family protein [bacterium]